MPDNPARGDSIVHALAELIRSIRARFARPTEYGEVALPHLPAESQREHLRALARKFQQRGDGLKRRAAWTLAAAIVLIAVGVGVFLVPTRFTDVKNVKEQIDKAYLAKHEVLTAEAEQARKYLRARALFHLQGLLWECYQCLRGYNAPMPRFASDPYHQNLLNDARNALHELLAEEPHARRYSFAAFRYHKAAAGGDVKVSEEVFAEAAQQMSMRGLDLVGMKAALDRLKDSAGTDLEAAAVQKALLALMPVEKTYPEAGKQEQDLRLAMDEKTMNSLYVIDQIQEAEKRISDALIEINNEKSGWDPSQPWATLLTIRIGIVVLLLYLTTVLLATYRYTLTLAAFYVARSDAIQMLSHQPEDRLFDVEELKAIIPMLSPDDYRIDKDVVPYESIGRGAAVITRTS